VIAVRWINPSFNPDLPPSVVHQDYYVAIDCSYNKVKTMKKPDSDKVRDLWLPMQTNLNLTILDWDMSSQGDDGVQTNGDNDVKPLPARHQTRPNAELESQ
jgi:hypothetical protein